MISNYNFIEWPQAQMPAAAYFALGRYFWLFLGLMLLLAVTYVLISRERAGSKLLKKKMPYPDRVEAQ